MHRFNTISVKNPSRVFAVDIEIDKLILIFMGKVQGLE